MTRKRIYAVTDTQTTKISLVRAISASQSISHVIKPRYSASVATQDQLVALLADGQKVEDASAEDEKQDDGQGEQE